ncbi:MAG: autotransporter-associated beta strand repeat-containing protein [Bacteroidaceae bacterium]|nr:autotransporter-associated beta strand repeat-containing protein [Bacteroidaceae bacterium]
MKAQRLTIGLLATLLAVTATAQQLAFPDAKGWGRFATGGRAGSVYHVTNLNDSGSGSLRDAVSQPNRIVVFDVAGVIKLNSRLSFAKNLTLAGQTAPGEGVVVYGDAVSFSGADNAIVRYMRFRMGKGGAAGKDAVGIANGTKMIFDHCSVSWGLDETFSINWDNKGTAPADITIQNCIIGQGLLTHSAGGLIQADRITLYRNFYCDNDTRNNKIKGVNQYVNCLVYNWLSGCYLMGGDSEGTSYANATNNLFINGPAGGGNAMTGANAKYHIYAADNWQDRNANGRLDPYEIPRSEYSGGPTFESRPFDYPELPAWKATQLVDSLLPQVGASLPYRDLADHYMVHQVQSLGTEGGIISSEAQLPIGVPTAWQMTTFDKPADSDGDGVPDAWEIANGTDPQKDDAMQLAPNGYANIENYINSLTRENREPFLRTPVLFSFRSSTDHSITLQWYDFTEGEDAFSLEMKQESEWAEVATAPAGSEQLTLEDLPAGTTFQVRMRATNSKHSTLNSQYTPTLTVKTQPKQAEMIDVTTYQPDLRWQQTEGNWNFTDANWGGQLFTNDTKVLIDSPEAATITLTETVQPAAVVVNTGADITLKGTGSIGGSGSVNKAGEGRLTVTTNNSYTGATVLHGGTFAFNTLKNGDVPSAIGASSEFGQNWIWDGGIWNYTGTSTQTNRSADLYADTEFDVNSSAATVTMNGSIQGMGNVSFGGKGKVQPAAEAFFGYDGATILRSGTLHLAYLGTLEDKKLQLGKSTKLVLAGGTFSTKDANDNYTSYLFPIEAAEGTKSVFEPYRNCYIKSAFTGTGTIDFHISWVREYLQGDMTGFYGRLIGNGTGTSNQLVLDTKTGIPNGVVELKGSIMMIYWQTNGDLHIGGLSGTSQSVLGGSSKQSAGHKMTWRIGGANTDETFAGIINDCASNTADKYRGTTSIVKEGSGDWRLTGTNIYTGTTTVEGGRLIVNSTHNGGGAYTVKDGATLMGRGTIGSRVTVQSGGTLCAGDTAVTGTTLKLTGGLTLSRGAEVLFPVSFDGTTVKCNRLSVNGTCSIGGATLVLDLDRAQPLPDGTELKLFQSTGSVSGAGFTTIIPAQPSDTQVWDDSTLLKDGILRVQNRDQVGIRNPPSHTPLSNPVILYDLQGRAVTLHLQSPHSQSIYVAGHKKVIVP